MSANRLILRGADLIDGSGGPVIADSTVVIDGQRLTYAGRATDRFDRPGAQHWELHNKTIIPGLIEAHTHAAFDADMLAYLRNGVTTIRFAGQNQTDVERLCRRIDGGELIGPRILSLGPMIDEPPPAYPEWSVAVTTQEQAAAAAERLILEHDLEALIVTQRVTAPIMKAIIDVAHAHGRRVVGQIWAVDGEEAAKLGIDELHTGSLVYRSKLYPKTRLLNYASIADRLAMSSRAWASLDWEMTRPIIETMVERGVGYCGMQVLTQFQVGEGVEFLKTDASYHQLFGDSEKQAFRDFTRRLQGSWKDNDLDEGRRANDKRMDWMRRFRDLGGVLLAGTDMQFGGIMLHRELKNLEEIGMSRLEVITAATGGCAKALGMDSEFGMVRETLSADLVVLNRNPLKDLTALRDISWVLKDGATVWKDGEFYAASDIA